MKKLISTIVLLTASMIAFAQNKGYECLYQEKIDLSDKLSQFTDDAGAEFVRSFLEKRKSYYMLTYANGKSLFEKDQTLSDDDMGMGNMIPVIYVDFDKQEQTSQYNFFNRNFYIVDSLMQMGWVLTNETREICGLQCTKATVETDSIVITAWFSMETPIPAGPQTCYGLPGLVVEMTAGPVTYTMTKITPLEKDPKLKQPTKGKKMTQEEFKALVEEKIKSMNFGGGNAMIFEN